MRRFEAYSATRKQSDRPANEDAVLIREGFVALADGAGAALGCAKKALDLLARLFVDKSPSSFEDWKTLARLLDSSMAGGPQSTLVVLFPFGEKGVAGVYVGDSRAYRVSRDGRCALLTDTPQKARLGSGHAAPSGFMVEATAGDTFLLMSDGAWTPLGLPERVGRTFMKHSLEKHLSDVPSAILDAQRQYLDDATIVIARILAA